MMEAEGRMAIAETHQSGDVTEMCKVFNSFFLDVTVDASARHDTRF